MPSNKSFLLELGNRLASRIDDTAMTYEKLSEITGISESRLLEITRAEGEEITIEEITLLYWKGLISSDYLLGLSDKPFPFEPTQEGLEQFAQRAYEYWRDAD